MHQQLIIQFKNRKKALIFQGRSWLRKNLEDEVSIYHDRIILSFVRSEPRDLQFCMFSKHSLFRYEIQKTLCFYLSVNGMLPEVKEISLQGKRGKQILENIDFTKKWSKCRVARLLEATIAARIFDAGENVKATYIALTYYLKAQMDHYSHDRFRAAWSGLNVVYTCLAPNGTAQEWKKIKIMKTYFEKDALSQIPDYVSRLDEQFWNDLDWYAITRKICTGGKGEVVKIDTAISTVFELQDPMLITRITGYMKSVVYTDQEGKYGKKSDYQRYSNEIKRIIEKNVISNVARARFLVADYCYMLRNRSFHAEKAYPLFVINKEADHKTVEEVLTELILMTMEGLLKEL